MEKEYADHVVKRKRLSKTKTVIIYRRNNLSIKDLIPTDYGYYYEEDYVHKGIKCRFRMDIYSKDFYDIFLIDTKSYKIKGGRNQFGVFVRMADQCLPIEVHDVIGCVEFSLWIKGSKERLYYDKSKKCKKETQGVSVLNTSSRAAVSIPSSVTWSARHPYRGGGFNPK